MSAPGSPAPPAAPRPAVVAVAGHDAPFPVRRIYCVGRNYLEHIREMQEGDERDPPFFFQKPADAVVSDGARVPYPPCTDDLQHEVELVVAIGDGGRDLSVSRALEAVYGYAVGVDLTRRDRQREAFAKGLPWEIGKAFDHSAPCGMVHPVAVVGHRLTGEIRLSVNGEPRQRGDLRQMIWNVPEIVAQLSRLYRLVPGDLVMTGTPAGVGALRPGDRVEAAVEGLSPLTFTIAPAEA
ncbi:MAG TPA: fumarylacetoacetate hydrolase family protein [Zeimonas sp.]|nr:fumarylacetoacetate hydrolase family protein [Zeimonas sp.]